MLKQISKKHSDIIKTLLCSSFQTPSTVRSLLWTERSSSAEGAVSSERLRARGRRETNQRGWDVRPLTNNHRHGVYHFFFLSWEKVKYFWESPSLTRWDNRRPSVHWKYRGAGSHSSLHKENFSFPKKPLWRWVNGVLWTRLSSCFMIQTNSVWTILNQKDLSSTNRWVQIQKRCKEKLVSALALQ